MESENTIKEIKLEIPDLTIKDSNNKTSKTYNHDKNVAVVLFILAVFCFIYDVFISDVKTCLNQTELFHTNH